MPTIGFYPGQSFSADDVNSFIDSVGLNNFARIDYTDPLVIGSGIHIGEGVVLTASHVVRDSQTQYRTLDQRDFTVNLARELGPTAGLSADGEPADIWDLSSGLGQLPQNWTTDIALLDMSDTLGENSALTTDAPILVFSDPNDASGVTTSIGFPFDGQQFDGVTPFFTQGSIGAGDYFESTPLFADLNREIFGFRIPGTSEQTLIASTDLWYASDMIASGGHSGGGVFLEYTGSASSFFDFPELSLIGITATYAADNGSGPVGMGFSPVGNAYEQIAAIASERRGFDADQFPSNIILASQNAGGTVVGSNAFNEVIVGSRFSDTLSGGNTADTLIGGEGNDTIVTGTGASTVIYRAGWDDDTIYLQGNNNTVELEGVEVERADFDDDYLTLNFDTGDTMRLAIWGGSIGNPAPWSDDGADILLDGLPLDVELLNGNDPPPSGPEDPEPEPEEPDPAPTPFPPPIGQPDPNILVTSVDPSVSLLPDEAIALSSLFEFDNNSGMSAVGFAVQDRTPGGGRLLRNGEEMAEEVVFLNQPFDELGRWTFQGASEEDLAQAPGGRFEDEIGFTLIVENGNFSPRLAEGAVVTTVCFVSGTLIETESGRRRVETLRPGDRVLTREHGYQPLVWTGKRELSAEDIALAPQLAPIRIEAGALGAGLPEHPLRVSPRHRVLLSSAKAELMFGSRDVLVAAEDLLGRMPGVCQDHDVRSVCYVHVMCATHQVICSEGAWSESFQPSSRVLTDLDASVRGELLRLFPELRQSAGLRAYAAAHPVLHSYEVRLLLAA